MKLILTGIILSSLSFLNLPFLDSSQLSEHIHKDEGVNISKEKPVLSFSTSVKFGKQVNQLSVLISTDFDGKYNEESIKKATWQKIGKAAKLATGEEFENSGEIDIASMVKTGKPFYIAFKYIGEAPTEGKPTQRTWQIKDVKISETALTNFNIVNSTTNGEKVGWVKTQQGIVYRPSGTLLSSEGWAISDPISL